MGSTPAPSVAGHASRPASCLWNGHRSLENFAASDVFREGAENSTRGALPISISICGFKLVLCFLTGLLTGKIPLTSPWIMEVRSI